MSTTQVVLFASGLRYKMSAESSKDQTIYKYVKEQYPVSKEHLDAHEH
jgi:hypothetical protein